ncbi:aspartyl protease family protein [Rhodanobacter sp. DHG33]|uniref:aspartyl protease family protein n=1 Tax=Rhodanobacter sp. DHG33 TaxID=2775921 RepID=UPI00177FFD2A|nr:aspartyl protease family protein [Rhodanobacter sp. DHG33]MBD8899510.1 aspartyl protease family protein [Rhodanobacter sp. DHG33]
MVCAGAVQAGECKLAKYGTLPVEVVGERATTQIKINGVDTRLILDTGAEFNFMSRANADALGLRLYPAPFGFHMGGVGGSASAQIAKIKDFGLLGTDFHDIPFLVGGSDSGEGLLGASLLDVVDLEIDLAQGKLTLFKSDGCGKTELAYWATGRSYNVADLQPSANRYDNRSFVDVTINGKVVHALLDTGAPVTVLGRRAAERVGIDLNGPGVKAGGGTHGIGTKTYRTWIVPIDTFSVGTETIQHSQMQVMDGNIGNGSTDMLLGIDFVLAHHMYIANSQGKIYFTYNGGRVFALDTKSIGANEPADAAASDAGDEPRTAADYALRGQARLARGELANAQSDLDAAIRLAPSSADDYLIRARILLAEKHRDAALGDLDKALDLDPKNLDALLLRARLRYGKKDEAGVEADIAAARQLAPSGSMQSYAIASLYVAIDQPANALPLLDDWISAHNADATLGGALNARCWARALANQALDDALRDCRKAIKRDGNRAAYLDSLGMVYLRMGNNAEAIKAYQEALAQSPHEAWSHYGLGLAELHNGQADAGKADLATARSLDSQIDASGARFGLVAPDMPSGNRASGEQPSN